MFENEIEHHPDARLIDLYKLYMQSCLGPGHIISDYDSVKKYLIQEVNESKRYVSTFKNISLSTYFLNLKGDYINLYSSKETLCTCPCLVLECDAINPLARYSLQLIADGIISLDEFYQIFIKSYEETKYMSEEFLIDVWYSNALPILMGFEFNGFEEDLKYINELFKRKEYLISHSEIYRAKYKPSYRLINKKYVEPYKEKILERYFIFSNEGLI